MFKKAFLLLVAAWGAFVIWQLAFSRDLSPTHGEKLTVQLKRGPFTVYKFESKQPSTVAIILFGSGDGGWSTFEEAIGQACQKQGYEMIGIDSRKYADTDYDAETLQSDFQTIAETARKSFPQNPPPLIIGGYSMGAAQAAAAAGGPHPPARLTGLLVVDMLARGRYGLRTADEMNVLPTGPGTFGVADFSDAVKPLRIVQWHAERDGIDSTEWLNTLEAPHRKLVYPGVGHGYEQDDRKPFLDQLMASIGWILDPKKNGPIGQEAVHE
jgi:hypothetical protein